VHDSATYKVQYRFKKAALRQIGFACLHMSRKIIEIALIFYKEAGIHGHCSLSEAYFWRQQALESKMRGGEAITEADREHDDENKHSSLPRSHF
jgi:hypothetical protein